VQNVQGGRRATCRAGGIRIRAKRAVVGAFNDDFVTLSGPNRKQAVAMTMCSGSKTILPRSEPGYPTCIHLHQAEDDQRSGAPL
jgi:hypothetical protein